VGGIEISGSASVEVSIAGTPADSAGEDSGIGTSGCIAGGSEVSIGFVGMRGLRGELAKMKFDGAICTYFSTAAGFFGAGAGVANMLAQLFLTPSGIMLDATLAAVDGAASVAVEPQASLLGCSSSVGAAPHAVDSTVGTEGSIFSLREPLVCATDAPRPRPPLPRSAPRLRPLPPSVATRPPRETLPWLDESAKVVIVASFALDRDRSFLAFETSPHCVIDPVTG
jgi:hypothetical protein